METMGVEAVTGTLRRLAERRFLQKVAAFERELESTEAEVVLFRALSEAMGYGGDRASFVALASSFSWAALRTTLEAVPATERVQSCEAALLGAAGLLEASLEGRYFDDLRRRWSELDSALAFSSCATTWLAVTRPNNHPRRRLAGLARLLARHCETGLLEGLSGVSGEAKLLVASLIVPADGPWATGRGRPALIGKARAVEIAMNAVLPVLGARAHRSGSSDVERVCLAIYRQLPLPAPYGAVAFLKENLGSKAVRTGADQQALLYLLQNYYSRGGCGRCSLS